MNTAVSLVVSFAVTDPAACLLAVCAWFLFKKVRYPYK
jgi:hypothetical protein